MLGLHRFSHFLSSLRANFRFEMMDNGKVAMTESSFERNRENCKAASGFLEIPKSQNPAPPIPNPQSLISKSPSLPVSPSPPLRFTLLLDPPGDGAWNMAVDETLLEAAADSGQCTLRFYQWAVPTLSLGYFQSYESRRQHSASRDCPVVRRASGGGAILHDREWTYSLALPEKHPLAVNRLGTYRLVHESLIETLAVWGISAGLFNSEGMANLAGDCSTAPVGCGELDLAPQSRLEPQTPVRREPFLCFQRRATGDLILGGVKIAGSAQRRCRGAVLQHGSVLLEKSTVAPELDGLKELTDTPISAEEFLQEWLATLTKSLAAAWQPGVLTDAQRARAAMLVSQKYASPDWTNIR
jgi:lipoate-protein ligase A